MAEAAVTFLLENLVQLGKYYADLIAGAEKELDDLKNDLGLLKGWLNESAKKQKKEAQFKALENQIREVVYDVEDTIDNCVTQASADKQKTRNFIRKMGKTKNRVNMAEEVKSMRDKIRPIYDEARRNFATMEIGDDSFRYSEQPTEKNKKDPIIRPLDKIVGFLDVTDKLLSYLREETDKLDVISIIGMAGQGKTTVAWKIFEDPKVKYDFHTRIWVYVSHDFSIRNVFLSIIKAFTQQDMSGSTDNELSKAVHFYLQKGKFLLVMDDVSEEGWEAIKAAMPVDFAKGKVVITSRYERVGTRASTTRDPYKLRFLHDDESWELLQLEAFKKRNVCPKDLVNIGRDIAKKCGGLPLALVVIGGILHDKYSIKVGIRTIIDYWEKVSENVGSHFKIDDKEGSIGNIVSLSYDRLSSTLRDCFLYMGMFPLVHEIPTSTVTKLWIAEGFIQSTDNQTLEETAGEILQDLIARNLVMVEMRRQDGEVKTCRVHDVLREFCKKKAAPEEQNLFQELKWTEGQFFPSISELHKFRRLSIHSHIPDFLYEKPNGKRVRTFLCFYKKPEALPAEYTNSIPDAFNLLRVLDVRSLIYPQFPIKVTKLLHLRYITLCLDYDLNELPEAIARLWNLQTINVETKSRTLKVKESVWELVQLRHLKTNACIVVAAEGKGKAGKNLQTLDALSVESCNEKLFDRAPNLKKLGIHGDLTKLANTKGLEKLKYIEKLKLKNYLLGGRASAGPFSYLPPGDRFPQKLKRLTLLSTHLGWDHISSLLGGIKTLQVLKLKENACKGGKWATSGSGSGEACFPYLDFLLISDSELEIWEVAEGDFPNLRCLVLKNCEQLVEVPSAFKGSLQILEMNRVSQSAVETAEKTGYNLSLGPGDK